MVNVRVFQLKDKHEVDNATYHRMQEAAKLGKANSIMYRQFYRGPVPEKNLNVSQDHMSYKYAEHCCIKPSTGDIIEIADGDDKGFYFMDGEHLHPVAFDADQADCEQMVTALIVEEGKEPYPAELRDDFGLLIQMVGGFPNFMNPDEDISVIYNDMFLMNGSMPNRCVGETLIHGLFIVAGTADEFEEANFKSLTPEQITKYSEELAVPCCDPEPSMDEDESIMEVYFS